MKTRSDLILMAGLGMGIGCAGPGAGTRSAERVESTSGTAASAPAFVSEPPAGGGGAQKGPVLTALGEELARGMRELREQDPPPYFAALEVHDRTSTVIIARGGALLESVSQRWRSLDTDVRVGDYRFDSTRPLDQRATAGPSAAVPLPTEDDAAALRSVAWLDVEQAYKSAAERLIRLRARKSVAVERDDLSDDFSREKPVVYLAAPATAALDVPAWEQRLRALSARFLAAPDIIESQVTLVVGADNRSLVNSEGSVVQTGRANAHLDLSGRTRADDGQILQLQRWVATSTAEQLPDEAALGRTADGLIADLQALRTAPVAEPASGPAILEGRAAAVFFHEIFGHRVEGHRQKAEGEGQTFAKMVGQPVMPRFISVYDDPQLARLGDVYLNGFYRYDDEGVPAQRADLVTDGVLKGFLLGRTPTRGFISSNGHGRRQEGFTVVPRQANLVVQPSLAVPRAALTDRLRAEARRQGRSYGLRLAEVEGGFTTTARTGSQAFKVLPLLVYRVYVDGRPDELIRGANLVGTPLTSLAHILAASDDYQVFNGYCGAESGRVPVSAISPSLLLEQLEIERKAKGDERPPILPPPPQAPGGGA